MVSDERFRRGRQFRFTVEIHFVSRIALRISSMKPAAMPNRIPAR